MSGVAALRLDDTQLVTLGLESGNWVRFQPDTGAQCNAMPLNLYMKAHKDFQKRKVNPRILQYTVEDPDCLYWGKPRFVYGVTTPSGCLSASWSIA